MFNRILTTLLVAFLTNAAFARQYGSDSVRKAGCAKLTTDLCVGIPVLQLPNPQRDLLLSNQTQYNVIRRFSVVSYTGLLLYAAMFRNTKDYIRTDHSYSVLQRIGIGTTFYTRGTTHGFFLMTGYKYSTVKSTMSHPDFPKITTSYSSLVRDFGAMYNLKVGRKRYFFSGTLYMPLHKLPLEFIENATIEFGAGIVLIK